MIQAFLETGENENQERVPPWMKRPRIWLTRQVEGEELRSNFQTQNSSKTFEH